MSYHQLTILEQELLSKMHLARHSLRETARTLQSSPSPLFRELRRYRTVGGTYSAHIAQRQAEHRDRVTISDVYDFPSEFVQSAAKAIAAEINMGASIRSLPIVNPEMSSHPDCAPRVKMGSVYDLRRRVPKRATESR